MNSTFVTRRLVVEHEEHGSGLVLTTPLSLGPGLPVVVRFAHGLECVSRERLKLMDGRPWPLLPKTSQGEKLSHSQRTASRWLESLRLGTVAYGEEVEGDLFTVGRESELIQIERDLRATIDKGGACRVFCGSYGVGKSHLLSVLSHRARARNLVVSRVVLDRDRVSACRPRRLYREIVKGLCFPESCDWPNGEAGLTALVHSAVAAGSTMMSEEPWHQHAYFTPLLRAWRALDESTGPAPEIAQARGELLYWIAGGERSENRRLRAELKRLTRRDPGPLYAIKDHRTVWNQLTYLVTGLVDLLRETGAGEGMVLIVDEAEMCAVEKASDQRHGDRSLTGLAAAALGGRKVPRPELLRETGGHRATRDFPALFRSRNHLYLALGMATRASGREVLARLIPADCFSDLVPLQPEAVSALLEKILLSYQHAFPHFEVGMGFAGPLGKLATLHAQGASSPRQIVQRALAFLDGARLWPGSIETYIEECLQL